MSIKINGDSMLPFLKPTSEVRFKVVSANKVKLGDIVAYYEKNSHTMVIHRVIRKIKNGYLVKGDNNWHIDPQILTSNMYLILKEISYKNKIWKIDTKFGKLVNKTFLFLSVIRIFPIIHRRKFRNRMMCN